MTPTLAIDQSTSGTKALLLDSAGRVVARASRNHQQYHPRPGWIEHDANEIWANLNQVIHELLSETEIRPGRVSISNQRETFVLFNRNGVPVRPAVVWQCRRGLEACRQLEASAASIGLSERTGLILDTYFPAPKLFSLFLDDPALREGLRKGAILFGTIDTFLIYRMTGGRTYTTDATNASRTLFYDLRKRGWDSELTGLFDVPEGVLPAIASCSDCLGYVRTINEIVGLPIQGVMGDSQASFLAQHCVSSGDLKVTVGTGSSVLLGIGNIPCLPVNAAVCALGWRIGEIEMFCLEGLINYAAATLAWLKDQLGLFDSIEEAESLAMSVEDAGGVTLVPAFSGLGMPHWKPDARARIVGLSAHSSRAHVVRAAYDSIGLQIRDVVRQLSSDLDYTIDAIRIDGGPTRSKFLMDLTASLTGCRLEVNPNPELSPVGAAMAGCLGAGELDMETLKQTKPADVHYLAGNLNEPVIARTRADWEAALHFLL